MSKNRQSKPKHPKTKGGRVSKALPTFSIKRDAQTLGMYHNEDDAIDAYLDNFQLQRGVFIYNKGTPIYGRPYDE